jgi:uncharacterized phage protein (TIGR01671 family)
MIEIKFRTWDTNKKILFNVSEIHFGNNFYIKGLGDIFSRNFVLMQYTGLKDKKGKEIYEGDIVTFEVENNSCWFGPSIGIIEFNNFNSSFEIKLKDCFLSIGKGYDAYRGTLEIVGNIYEHPHLLETK